MASVDVSYITNGVFLFHSGMLLYFGYSIWNSSERFQKAPNLQQKIFDRQVLLADDADIVDINYEMETIPAHRDDLSDLPPSPFKWDSLCTKNVFLSQNGEI